MNLQQLKYVKALVDEGSFIGAAGRCAVTQPTLSNGIAHLEAELGNRLFRRTTRSVKLTAYGEQLLPSILEVLRSFDNLIALSRNPSEKSPSTVQVALSPIVGIQRAEKILSRFKAKNPGISIVYRECNFRDLYDLLSCDQIDIALTPFDTSLALNKDCLLISLESDPLVFVPMFSERGSWANIDNVSLADIAHERFILVPDSCGLTSCTKQLFEKNNLILRQCAGEASTYSSVQEWAHMNLAAGILPKSRVRDDEVVNIPIVHNGHPITIDYFALGKPSTMSPHLFSQVWDSLLETKLVSEQSIASAARDRQSHFNHLAVTNRPKN
jgi:DNA-binding transcriptional LysR family regulator